MTSLFYFIAACAITIVKYSTFLNLIGLVVFCAMVCICTDLHFKPTYGATVAALVVLWFVPGFFGVLLWICVAAIDAAVRGEIK